jgi:hypothetical protein
VNKAEEYKKLSYEQKGQQKKLCANRKNPDTLSSQMIAALQSTQQDMKTAVLNAQIAALQAKIDELEESLCGDKSSDEVEEAPSGNRNNSALTHQPTKRKAT